MIKYRLNGGGKFGLLLAMGVLFTCSSSLALAGQLDGLIPLPTAADKQLLESGKQLTNQVVEQISTVEWLGPLAPIALSPFFGMACLSGIATYGPEWLQQRSAIFGDSSPLNNPALFWSMVALTIVSSLPRLSKVSKPVAMAVDKLETYSVVIIVILMRVFSVSDDASSQPVAQGMPIYLTAGIGTLPFDVAIAIASAFNILVINGVKLFCELVIWLTPIPLVDAVVEATNKSLCVGLMSLYCWSPLIATIVNLILLAICGCMYLWTQRRVVYYLDLVAGPFFENWLPWGFAANADGEIVFLAESWNGLPKLLKLRLSGSPNGGWKLTRRRWWGCVEHTLPPCQPQLKVGLFAQTIQIVNGSGRAITLHHRLSGRSQLLATAA
jgi:hypothetical protein